MLRAQLWMLCQEILIVSPALHLKTQRTSYILNFWRRIPFCLEESELFLSFLRPFVPQSEWEMEWCSQNVKFKMPRKWECGKVTLVT